MTGVSIHHCGCEAGLGVVFPAKVPCTTMTGSTGFSENTSPGIQPVRIFFLRNKFNKGISILPSNTFHGLAPYAVQVQDLKEKEKGAVWQLTAPKRRSAPTSSSGRLRDPASAPSG